MRSITLFLDSCIRDSCNGWAKYLLDPSLTTTQIATPLNQALLQNCCKSAHCLGKAPVNFVLPTSKISLSDKFYMTLVQTVIISLHANLLLRFLCQRFSSVIAVFSQDVYNSS